MLGHQKRRQKFNYTAKQVCLVRKKTQVGDLPNGDAGKNS